MRALVALLVLSSGCAVPLFTDAAPENELIASGGESETLRLAVTNESREMICYVQVLGEGRSELDRLEPDDVIAPGERRFFPVAAGPARLVLLDCSRDVMLARAVDFDAAQELRFRTRE